MTELADTMATVSSRKKLRTSRPRRGIRASSMASPKTPTAKVSSTTIIRPSLIGLMRSKSRRPVLYLLNELFDDGNGEPEGQQEDEGVVVEGGGAQDLEDGGRGEDEVGHVAAVVEERPQSARVARLARLLAVDVVEDHVEEEGDAELDGEPAGDGLVGHAEAVAEEQEDVGEEGEHEAGHGDLLSGPRWGW